MLNKGLSRDDLAQAAVAVSRAGIPQLRLYFMVGLPTETLADMEEIPRLVRYLEHCVVKDSLGKRRLGLITLSISSFVPKPFTPFQWTPFLDVAELKKRLKLVTREFHGVKEVRVHTDLPKWAYVQALLARGDRRVGDILLAAHQHGWNRAFRESPVNPDFFTLQGAPPRRTLPLGLHRPRPAERLPVGGIPAGLGRERDAGLPSQDLQTLRDLRGRGVVRAVLEPPWFGSHRRDACATVLNNNMVRRTHPTRRAPEACPRLKYRFAFKWLFCCA